MKQRIEAIEAEMAEIRHVAEAGGRALTDAEKHQLNELSIQRAAAYRQMHQPGRASNEHQVVRNPRVRPLTVILLGISILLLPGLLYQLQLLPDIIINPTGEEGVPREGLFRAYPLFGSSFDDWQGFDDGGMKMYHQNESLHLAVEESLWTKPQTDDFLWWTVWGKLQRRSNARDLSASVDVRAISASESAGGCLLIRADRNVTRDNYAYNFCIRGDGIYGWRSETDASESGPIEYFDSPEALSAVRPITDWNTLKVIAHGDTAWLFVNGVRIGTTQHAGTRGGTVGVRIEVYRPEAAEFAFRNLTVRGLGWI